ncbi:alternative oxidase [Chlorella sorokiniana]|uniref:Ubiquinol oxidase n=1 Tax=Chlorella sorokiniana TaxID=3076 RepID=A0A2P6TWU0_CHLSO|nr:alternative oxidase [Chlorella sorokiniana]|eukprot:PRW58530.1 alternative oxidase [Chlorella sorokiniana]
MVPPMPPAAPVPTAASQTALQAALAAAGVPYTPPLAASAMHWGTGGSGSGSAATPPPGHHPPVGVPLPSSAYASVSAWSRDAAGIARSVKVVVSSGGCFLRLPSGAWEYEGGETRLVSLPFHSDYQGLLEALERTCAPLGCAGGGGSDSASDAAPRTFAPQLKYRLPSDPSVWCDLLDDEDVTLMWDELDEHRSGGIAPVKLHLFVQWRSASDLELGDSEMHEEEPEPVTEEDAQAVGAVAQQRRHPSDSRTQSAASPPKRQSVDLASLVEKMEVIRPDDVQLVRFLGSGGYGDVYLGRWHGSDVAVKCLNPSLFFDGGEMSAVNRGAIIDLIREAELLASMRHPNIVWVYGIVLPSLTSDGKTRGYNGSESPGSSPEGSGEAEAAAIDAALDEEAAESRRGHGNGIGGGGRVGRGGSKDVVDAIASGMQRSGMQPGMVRPPAMVTEYMAGGSLKSALGRKADIVAGALTRVVLALDAAKGLEYLHSKSMVHFDVKSSNLLLGYRDRRPVCKVADFGLVKERMQTYVTGVNSQRGTLPWTAPEIIRTPDSVTEKIDVFSFGVVLWELWTGLEPYAGMNYHALMLRLANPAEQLRPPLPGSPDWEGEPISELAPGWRVLMERCWADSPDDRPAFSEIIRELRAMVAALKPKRNGSAHFAAKAAGLPQPEEATSSKEEAGERLQRPLPGEQEGPPPEQDAVVQPHPGIQRTVSKPEDVTYMYTESIKPTHRPPVKAYEKAGYWAVQALRSGFDMATGYGHDMSERRWLRRFIFLETVAGVPGMVAGMLRHMRSLRSMRRDHGWIHTLLEEAENERMHLLTFLTLRHPGPLFRAAVLVGQGVMFNAYLLAYLLSPRACHAFVGYLEEQAVATYSNAIQSVDSGGGLAAWASRPAPPIATMYWRLPQGSTLRDVLLSVRADEACHSHVNFVFSEMGKEEQNPFEPGSVHVP